MRVASLQETDALARLINDAFIVEAFFKIGDRTSAAEVAELMHGGGEFLVLDGDEPGIFAGCIYLKCNGEKAYFGMLSIDPRRQRQGHGRRLISAAEARAREHGCLVMDIHIVNLREELFPYYEGMGYEESGTLPFSDVDRASRPCSFIVMSKRL